MNVGEFINSQALLSGLAADDSALKEFLSNPELSKIVVPDAISSQIKSSLLTVEQAKTNSDLKRHFTANALDPVDAKIKALIEEYQLPDDVRSQFDAEKNSYNKLAMLAKELQAAEIKKLSAKGGDKQALVDEIAKLNAAILKEQTEAKNLISKAQSEHEARIYDLMLDNYLASQEYGNGMDKDVNVITSKALLQSAIAEKKAKIAMEGNKFKLVNSEDPLLPYNENHSPVDFDTFTKRLLNEKKMLKVSGGDGNNNNNRNQYQAPNNGATKIERPAAAMAADEALQNFMKNSR
jgi:hypothetical protein